MVAASITTAVAHSLPEIVVHMCTNIPGGCDQDGAEMPDCSKHTIGLFNASPWCSTIYLTKPWMLQTITTAAAHYFSRIVVHMSTNMHGGCDQDGAGVPACCKHTT